MDLVNIFNNALGNNEDYDSVMHAIDMVDQHFGKYLIPESAEEDCLRFVFEDGSSIRPLDTYYELYDFWKRIEPFVWDMPEGCLENFWIIQIIQEAEMIRNVFMFNQLLDMESARHLKMLQKLANSIEDEFRKKYLIELEEGQQGYFVSAVYPLRHFDEQCYHEYRDFLMQKLYLMLRDGGRLILVAGSKGLTPQRVYEYRLKNFKWRRRMVKNPEDRLRYLSEEQEEKALKRGLIHGFVKADLWE
ncbi:MAG: hypothetical protein PHW34_13560 [Hespellia sp.]|nr:hypothetical protein [Hespellia sp.]